MTRSTSNAGDRHRHQRHHGHRKSPGAYSQSSGEGKYLRPKADLRLGVQGGGCSGLSYNISFDTQPRERDRIFQFGDVRVFVDPKSFIYLHGMVVDYEETLMRQGFVFKTRTRPSLAAAAARSPKICTWHRLTPDARLSHRVRISPPCD